MTKYEFKRKLRRKGRAGIVSITTVVAVLALIEHDLPVSLTVTFWVLVNALLMTLHNMWMHDCSGDMYREYQQHLEEKQNKTQQLWKSM